MNYFDSTPGPDHDLNDKHQPQDGEIESVQIFYQGQYLDSVDTMEEAQEAIATDIHNTHTDDGVWNDRADYTTKIHYQ